MNRAFVCQHKFHVDNNVSKKMWTKRKTKRPNESQKKKIRYASHISFLWKQKVNKSLHTYTHITISN